ncbi:hypothetical protein BGZ99_002668 [Dissophora globulifera]|uniref:Cytochrome P450 n=1 Tax=Dissophora globulifera TaxID=979702 RepID=A0A9P6RS61_9FUNG|nr:hypothetical protein BGZ99_002668 [Dissophora globulifera]
MSMLASYPSASASLELIWAALPFGIGLASAALVTAKKAAGWSLNNLIPTASLRPGDSTHDTEFKEDQDAFLTRCETEYGSMFNVNLHGKHITVISGSEIQEVFMNDSFSPTDAFEEMTGIQTFFNSARKSNHNDDLHIIHRVISQIITPKLALFTVRIQEHLETTLDKRLGAYARRDNRIIVEEPWPIFKEMSAHAVAAVFMGPESAQSPEVIDTFMASIDDFAKMFESSTRSVSLLRKTLFRATHRILSPLQVHVQSLVQATTPIILERRRREMDAAERGVEWERPDDVMQSMLDNFDTYNFVDLEDVCGHLLILVLTSLHSTSDVATKMMYFLAAFPDCIGILYREHQEALDIVQQEREQMRQELIQRGLPIGEQLYPSRDRDVSAAALKKMVRLDSFIREMFRFRSEKLNMYHRARNDVALSNGVVIAKGRTVVINMRSAHQGPDQGPEVTKFRPWRFVGKSKAATKVAADFLPFGMGK